MDTAMVFLKIVHIINAILMAWPFYALVAVNQRGRLGPPLGDRTDTYMENIIKNRTIPCFVFQATALVTGIALVLLGGLGLGALVTNPVLIFKFFPLLAIAVLLTYVHVSVQPRIDDLFAQVGSSPVSEEVAKDIGSLRVRRKRVASICLFVVLTVSMLGVQVRTDVPVWLTVLLVIAIFIFTLRAYKSVTPYGWA
jgi:hypothetical protein